MSYAEPRELAMLLEMFRDPCDRESRLWKMGDEPLEQLAAIPKTVGVERTFFIFNEFDDRQPLLINYDYLYAGRNRVNFAPSVVCDSNVASLLHRRVAFVDRMSPAEREVADSLLRTFVLHNVDYNSFFYLLESAAKSSVADFEKLSRAVDHSFLVLHSMDRERFLATGEIAVSPQRARAYSDQFDTPDFEEIASRRFRRIDEAPQTPQCDYIYANLLRMVEIHKGARSKATIALKAQLLRESMVDELGVVSAWELLFAPDYFAGLANAFISFEPNARFERQLQRLRAAAWDLFLLTIPPTLLAAGSHDEAILAMICTGDRAFYEIGRNYRFEMAHVQNGRHRGPMMSYDNTRLRAQIGDEQLNTLIAEAREFGRERLRALRRAGEHQAVDIRSVIAQREARLAELCLS